MRIRPRRLAIGAAASAAALAATILPAMQSKAGAAASVTYTYDAAGRIATVTNASGTKATYTYDAAGNVTAVAYSTGAAKLSGPAARPRPVAPSITGVSPSVVRSGDSVTISGRGFDPTAGNDVVRIGDLIAPVVSATSTRLVVTAPPATGGAVNLVTPGGSTTRRSVRILGGTAPVGVAAPVDPALLHGARHAARGVTAFSGLVERNDGKPLAGIKISISDGWDSSQASTTTNRSGWFLLTDLSPGAHVLYIDGGANRYGLYSEPVSATAGQTTVLPWITYLTPLDAADSVRLDGTTAHAVTLESPRLPGVKVVIPKGTTVTSASGAPVREVSLTALEIGRTPFPWAPNMEPPYFTLQPAGARVAGPGIQIIYPNQSNQPPGTRLNYLAYSATWGGSGWYTYGSAHVSADGRQVLPDPGTYYHTIVPGGYTTPPPPPPPGPPGGGPGGGEPVDLTTGLFTLDATDLSLSDSLPAALGRVYRPLDDTVRTFGIGTESTFDYIVQSNNSGGYYLFTPDGTRIAYTSTSTTNVYAAQSNPTEFAGSTLTQQGDSDGPFLINLTDGTSLEFSNPAYLISIMDRSGNKVTINRNDYNYPSNGGGQIYSITTPGGKWMKFTYGVCVPGTSPSDCVTSVTDSAGHRATYSYNSNGQLTNVSTPNQKTALTWGSCPGSLTCTEILTASHGGTTFVTNMYDPSSGRVTNQTVADGGQWTYSYITNGSGQVTQTNVTDPDGHISEYTWNANGYEASATTAAGTSLQQTVTPVYDPTTNLLDSYTDALGRQTTYTYDSHGNLRTETQNAGTSGATTTTYTYEPTYNRLATVTDALGHVTTFTYNDSARTVTTTDPLGKQTVEALNAEGQPISVSDPTGDQSNFSYLHGALVAYSDPLGDVTSFYDNGMGEPATVTDPLGHSTTYTWNAEGYPLTQVDPLGHKTTLTYNGNGEITSVTDPNGNKTAFSYDPMGRPLTETDPLSKTDSVTYDKMGRVLTSTDRDGNLSKFTYDALGRLATAKSGVSGSSSFDTVTYTYDAASRITKVVDSLTGTYTYTYNNLDELLTATGPNGKITYTYNADGQETSSTVGGQTKVTYGYNADGNPTGVTQGTSAVAVTYDSDQRPTSTTYPDGITETTTYNSGSLVTSMTYADGSTQLGALDYGYDADGHTTSLAGSLATTNLPAQVSSATYNADNELTALGSTAYTYDAAGNLLSNGTDTYTWNPEDQLASATGTSLAATFTYDPFGQRNSATVAGTTTSYLYNGNNVAQTLSGGTPVANMLTGGLDRTYQVTNPSGTFAVLPDRLGDTIALGSSTGTLSTTYAYDPFGGTTSSGAVNPNASGYLGAQYDSATGLYYLGARYYDPAIERFASQDPSGIAGGTPNAYEYGYNQPTDFVDPLGLNPTPPLQGPGEGGGPNSGTAGTYHGTAAPHPTLVGDGTFAGIPNLIGGVPAPTGTAATSQIDQPGTDGASALSFYAENPTLSGTGAATSNSGLSPFTTSTGTPEGTAASYYSALVLSPTRLPIAGNALLATLPWSSAFWNGQGRW